MSTLYELTNDWLQLMDMLEDGEVDEDVINDTLEGLDYEIEQKADGYARVIRNLESDVAGLKTEIDRMAKMKTVIENNIARLKKNLQKAMELTGKTKFKTDLFSFNIQNNPSSVVIDAESVDDIPIEYLVTQPPKIDKKKISETIKAGVDLHFAHLEQTKSLRIK